MLDYLFSQKARLQHLKDNGFNPKGILDIGAHVGTWTHMVLDVFPDVNILMIEGNSDHAGKLEMVANRAKNISFEIELLSDIEKKSDLLQEKRRRN
jgi:ribosomal protein RSM22 (predicted rRNA methylase)